MSEVRDILDIMNSDFRLWERAESEELGAGKVKKTLDLPWGIGVTEVVLEGMSDAGKRRDAVAAYGDYIRGVIREATDDDAITSRAKVAAARVEQASSGDSPSVHTDQGLRDSAGQAPLIQGAGEAYEEAPEEHADLGATLTARRAALKERCGRVEADLARWRKELKGIDAALAAMEED